MERHFGNASEYFRDLIRERMRREIEADLKLLASTTKGAPAGPTEREIENVLAVQRQVRKELKNAPSYLTPTSSSPAYAGKAKTG